MGDRRIRFSEDAARLIVASQVGSTSLLQRRMKLGYNRAAWVNGSTGSGRHHARPNQGSKAETYWLKPSRTCSRCWIRLLNFFSPHVRNSFLLVGLGNIGPEYAGTRHNISFDVLHTFVLKHKGAFEPGGAGLCGRSEVQRKNDRLHLPHHLYEPERKGLQILAGEAGVPRKCPDRGRRPGLPLDKIRCTAFRLGCRGHNRLKDIQNILGTDNTPNCVSGIGNTPGACRPILY